MMDTVLVNGFVSVIGSVVEKPEGADDIDVLVRADEVADGYLGLQAESLSIAIRDVIREVVGRHELQIHLIPDSQGPHHGKNVPVADLVLRWRRHLEVEEIKLSTSPFSVKDWKPMKPAVKFFTENATPDQLWDEWGNKHAPFIVQPKLNGFRCLLVKSGNSVQIFFEDAKKDRAGVLQPILDEVKQIPHDFVLDGDIGVFENGERLPRPDHAVLLQQKVDWDEEGLNPVLFVFDILSIDGENVSTKPLVYRIEILERILPDGLKHISLIQSVVVETREELVDVYEQFSKIPGSEGVVCKDPRSQYRFGSSSAWSKIKNRAEFKVRVKEKKILKNGMIVYNCEWADGGETGFTMPTKIDADVGDVITVAAPELNYVETDDGWTITWENGAVMDIATEKPYTKEQALIVASRYLSVKILPQDKDDVTKSFATVRIRPPFRIFGSKFVLALKTIPLIPPHHRYVEPFAGSAAILFSKPRADEEIISDLDKQKVSALQYLQEATPEELKTLVEESDWRPSRERFREISRAQPRSKREALYRLLYLDRHGWHAAESFPEDYAPNKHSGPHLENLIAAHNRLKGVEILHQDALEVISKYKDDPDAFFYIDPPYLPAKGSEEPPPYHVGSDFGYDDWQKLIDLLKTVKGKFILSCRYGDWDRIPMPKEWSRKRLPHRYHSQLGTIYAVEAIVANFPLRKQQVRFQSPQVKETRTEISEEWWEDNWQDYYGDGTFVIQHHWRGLNQDELDLPDDELLRRGHSVHADVRFQIPGKDMLWGITVYADKDNSGLPGELMLSMKDGQVVRCGPKLPEPPEWFNVAKDKQYIAEPGTTGATSRKYGIIREVARGRLQCGVWNRHAQEIFLDGKRFMVQRVHKGTWLLVSGGQPIASRRELDDEKSRLAQRGHRLLIWSLPGKKPMKFQLGQKTSNLRDIFINFIRRLADFATGKKRPVPFKIAGDFIVIASSNRYYDTDGEVVTTDAIDNYVRSFPNGTGTINFWHSVPFADVVKAFRHGGYLFHIGKFHDSRVGAAFRQFFLSHPSGHPDIAPFGWGTSMGFLAVKGEDRSFSTIRHRETSILPIHRAANPWSPIEKGGVHMPLDREVIAALEAISPDLAAAAEELAAAAENSEDELTGVVASKSLTRLAGQMGKIAQALSGNQSKTAQKIQEDIAEADENDGEELVLLAQRVRKLAKKVSDDEVKDKLEAVAAALEKKAGRSGYGYGYPAPEKKEAELPEQPEKGQDVRYETLADRLDQLSDAIAVLQGEVQRIIASVEKANASLVPPVPVAADVAPSSPQRPLTPVERLVRW